MLKFYACISNFTARHSILSYSIFLKKLFSKNTIILIQNIIVSFIGRALNLFSTVLLIPIVVRSLGEEHYGIFAVILSINTFLAYSDFGLAQTIINDVAIVSDVADIHRARVALSQVWYFLLAIAAAIIIIGCGFVQASSHKTIFPMLPESASVIIIIASSTACGIPFGIAQRVFFALQLGVYAQLWGIAARISAFVAALMAAQWSPNISGFALAILGTPTLIAGCSCVHLFYFVRPSLRPCISSFELTGFRRRITAGVGFMILQIGNIAEITMDPILLGIFYGPLIVANYDITARLFNYVPALVSIGILPLWPALRAAQVRQDTVWIVHARRITTLIVPAVSICATAVIAYFLRDIIRIWIATPFYPSNTLVCLIAINTVLFSFYYWQTIQLNAQGLIMLQAAITLVYIPLLIIVKIFMLNFSPTLFLMPAIFINAMRVVVLQIAVIEKRPAFL